VFGVTLFPNRDPTFLTPPVTFRLQCYDNRFYSPARWVQALPALENIIHLREKLVILESQVAIGQRFERQKITEKKMDTNIDK